MPFLCRHFVQLDHQEHVHVSGGGLPQTALNCIHFVTDERFPPSLQILLTQAVPGPEHFTEPPSGKSTGRKACVSRKG